MKFSKRNILISTGILVIAALFQFFKNQPFEWIELSNTLFLIALPILIIGLFGMVLAAETFDFFHYSMRKMTKLKKNKNDGDSEEIDPHALSRAIGTGYRSVLTVGFILLILSIICLWDYIL